MVSGAVEPDTIIVDRDTTGKLSITKTELGSKNQRVKTEGSGTAMEDVPEDERKVACITNDQVLKLANIGVSQEVLWGAGRDIEWAVTEVRTYIIVNIKTLFLQQKHNQLHKKNFWAKLDEKPNESYLNVQWKKNQQNRFL